MNDVLKQRLVGALILVALGVIFWPIIFVTPGDREVADIAPVPPRPEVVEWPIEPPDQSGLRASPKQIAAQREAENVPEPELRPEDKATYPLPASATATPPESAGADHSEPAVAVAEPEPVLKRKEVSVATRKSSPEPLHMDGDGVPVAWILQVASVSSAEKAEQLRSRLVALNYKAYVTQVRSNGRTLHRVYLGPKFEKAVLEELQPDIDAEFGVQSMVRRYVP